MLTTTGKYLSIFALLLAFSGSALAELFVTWDQPDPGVGEVAAEGWQLFVNGTQVWSGSVQTVDLETLGLKRGRQIAQVRAFAGVDVSGFSNSLSFVIGPGVTKTSTERTQVRQGERSGSR